LQRHGACGVLDGDGAADHIRATVPAVWGEAIDVPLRTPYPPPFTDELTIDSRPMSRDQGRDGAFCDTRDSP